MLQVILCLRMTKPPNSFLSHETPIFWCLTQKAHSNHTTKDSTLLHPINQSITPAMHIAELYLAGVFYDVQMLTHDVKLRFMNLVTGAKHQLHFPRNFSAVVWRTPDLQMHERRRQGCFVTPLPSSCGVLQAVWPVTVLCHLFVYPYACLFL